MHTSIMRVMSLSADDCDMNQIRTPVTHPCSLPDQCDDDLGSPTLFVPSTARLQRRFSTLPLELLLVVASYCDVISLVILRRLSHRLRDVASHNLVWFRLYIDVATQLNVSEGDASRLIAEAEPAFYYKETMYIFRKRFFLPHAQSFADQPMPLTSTRIVSEMITACARTFAFPILCLMFSLLGANSVLNLLGEEYAPYALVTMTSAFVCFTFLIVFLASYVMVHLRVSSYRGDAASNIVANFSLVSLANYWLCAFLCTLQWTGAVTLSWILIGSPIVANASMHMAMLALSPCDSSLRHYLRPLLLSAGICIPVESTTMLRFIYENFPQSIACWAIALPVYIQVSVGVALFLGRAVLAPYHSAMYPHDSIGEVCGRVAHNFVTIVVACLVMSALWYSCQDVQVLYAILIVLWVILAAIALLASLMCRGEEDHSVMSLI